jgi:hypothetical protein
MIDPIVLQMVLVAAGVAAMLVASVVIIVEAVRAAEQFRALKRFQRERSEDLPSRTATER